MRRLDEYLPQYFKDLRYSKFLQVSTKQTGEPGWLAGEIRGHTGWFPESYVEPVDGVSVRDRIQAEPPYLEETTRLE